MSISNINFQPKSQTTNRVMLEYFSIFETQKKQL